MNLLNYTNICFNVFRASLASSQPSEFLIPMTNDTEDKQMITNLGGGGGATYMIYDINVYTYTYIHIYIYIYIYTYIHIEREIFASLGAHSRRVG